MEPVWWTEAQARFPDVSFDYELGEGAGMLWLDLTRAFKRAYDTSQPDLIRRIYAFAEWCCKLPEKDTAPDHMLTIVVTHFYEDIPTHPKALADMPNWWARSEVQKMRDAFSYSVGPEGFRQILATFGEHKAEPPA